ncbi:MAG: UDP-2,3-diacylglucosamine diphosphatase LpxI [Bacteroidales bacterium]|nr:UDP-2,3-diacylglucosamine diphosphatase LpxI [Bacteroidales bacterium]
MEKKVLGMIAGGGMMPVEIIRHCKATGREIFVVGIEPFAKEEELKDAPHLFARIGEVGKIFKAFKNNNVYEIVLAGGIKRPSFKEMIPDWEGMKILAKLAVKKMSDDSLFRAVMNEIESHGFKVVGIEEVVPDMMFMEGIYGQVKPSKEDMDDIQRGITVAKALGAVDVGQAVVVQEGMVLAVEAIEGTDMMLSRSATIKKEGKAPVVVKVLKPGQDMRVDLPAIGLQTIEQLKKYGMGGIAVEAGGILLIEREAVIKMADREGIFIIGVKIHTPA